MPLGPVPTAGNNVGIPIANGDYSRALSQLDPILALPTKRELFDPHNAQVRTYNSKQEAFNNQVVYLETFFEGALFETPNTFITDQIFPFRRYDDINFGWDFLNFPLFPAVRTAQLAPPVKLGFERREGRATMSRYSLSVEGLTEDQRTNLGKTVLTGLISAMSAGFMSMFELNGFRALFREPSIYQKYFFEAQIYDIDANKKLMFELEHFDQLRRSGTGFADLVNNAQQEMRDTQQLELSYAIIPPGARSIFAASPEMRFANLRGPGSQQIMDLQADAPEFATRFAGVYLLVARPYYFDGAGIVLSPLDHKLTIGGFGIQDNVIDGCEPSQFTTAQIEGSMFSVNDNKFIRLATEWMIDNNQRFDKVTGRLRTEHAEIAAQNYRLAARLGVPTPNYVFDMFVYHTLTATQKVQFDTASHWGQMESWALTDHVIDNIGKVSAYRAMLAVGEADWRSIERGLTLKNQIRAKVPTDDDIAFALVAAPPPTAPGETIAARGSLYGAQSLPTRAQLVRANPTIFGDLDGYLPYGYGTIGGLFTIADEAATSEQAYGYISAQARTIAADFAPAFKRWFQFYKALYTDQQVATNARYVPAVYKSSDQGEAGREIDEMLAFAYNIVDDAPLPMYVQGAGGGGGGDTGAGGREGSTRAVGETGATGTATSTARTTPGGAPVFEEVADVSAANGVKPYESFRDYVPAMLERGAPLQLQETFGTLGRFRDFEKRFNASKFADAYSDKLADDRARRSAQSSRTTRTLRVTPASALESLEDDDAAAAAQSDSPSPFVQFQYNEIMTKALSPSEAQRIWSRVAAYVNSGTAPVPLTNATIGSWKSNDTDARQTARVLGQAEVPQGAYLTRLSVPYPQLARGTYLASPLNAGQVLAPNGASSVALAALKKNSLTDIDVAPIFSMANGGLRNQAETVPAAERGPASGGYFGLSSAQPPALRAVGEDIVVNARGTGSSWLVVNENLRRRWLEAGRVTNIGERVGRRALLLAPITRDVCLSMANKNIPPAWAHLVLRPHKRYSSQAIVLLSMTPQTPIGFTATHDPRVNYISNGITEKFIIHVVLYTETINMRPERVMIIPDALITGYGGGDSLKPFTPATYVPGKLADLPLDGPSVIIVMQPAGSLFGKNAYLTSAGDGGASRRMFGSVLDIRGYFGVTKAGPRLGRALDLDGTQLPYASSGAVVSSSSAEPRAAGEDYPHYLSALYTNYVWPFKDLKVPGRMRACKFTPNPIYDNTVCLQERQKFCIGFGATVPTAQIAGKDHFADSTEDGCAARRAGKDNKPYSDIYKDLPILVG